MVGGHFADGAGQLCDLHLLLVGATEAREENLTLTGLEAIDQRRNGALVIHVREEDQLLVDELGVGDGARVLAVEVLLRLAFRTTSLASLKMVYSAIPRSFPNVPPSSW